MITESLSEAVNGGVKFLTDKQFHEGFWHDYDLEIGNSRAWTTAYVAKCLLNFSEYDRVSDALDKACRAIMRIKTPFGWGYNLVTAEDADTTAFCLYVLKYIEKSDRCNSFSLLSPYIDKDGAVRTFLGSEFGSWSTEHTDVAATVGHALLKYDPRNELAGLIAERIYHQLKCSGGIKAFWWESSFYLWAHVLEFYYNWNPKHKFTQEAACEFLSFNHEPQLPFEKGLYLKAKYYAETILNCRLQKNVDEEILLQSLFADQNRDGSWPSSALMKIPLQLSVGSGVEIAYDLNRLLTTATILESLYLLHY